ncbi:PREDICTED: putative UPF0481 protein At3g02645 [Nelumbo nucifera]|nr:PREDICTED: putative UPF0481 protein At3g02645 [Nelumbo nucifera]
MEEAINARMSSSFIPRVADVMRGDEKNKQCFEPSVVSLGPYHSGKPHLQRMEQYKFVSLKQYFKHDDDSVPFGEEEVIARCFQNFTRAAINAKNWYEIAVPENEENPFVWMMFLDICFLLNFMEQAVGTKTPSSEVAGGDNNLRLSSQEEAFVVRDIMLLENQLPFELVKTFCNIKRSVEPILRGEAGEGRQMYRRMMLEIDRSVPVAQQQQQQQQQSRRSSGTSHMEPYALMNAFVDKLIRHYSLEKQTPTSSSSSAISSSNPSAQVQPKHLLDLLRRKIIGEESTSNNSDEQQSTGGQWYSFRSIKELKDAGIKFKKTGTNQLKNIRFNSKLFRGELYLPVIMVDDSTKSRLLNIIAYEMGQGGPPDRAVTSYACFMDSLIDSAEDVKELRSGGILLNALGSDEEVADLFNTLTTGVTPEPGAYAHVKSSIESHCMTEWKVSLANLYHTHFNSPWTTIAFIAALFLLILTICQTFFAAFPREAVFKN